MKLINIINILGVNCKNYAIEQKRLPNRKFTDSREEVIGEFAGKIDSNWIDNTFLVGGICSLPVLWSLPSEKFHLSHLRNQSFSYKRYNAIALAKDVISELFAILSCSSGKVRTTQAHVVI